MMKMSSWLARVLILWGRMEGRKGSHGFGCQGPLVTLGDLEFVVLLMMCLWGVLGLRVTLGFEGDIGV